MNDLINREKAREVVCGMCRWSGTSNCDECEHPIADIPAEEKIGHWEERNVEDPKFDPYGFFKRRWYCSECGRYQTYGATEYCCHCGAKMMEEQT